MRPSNLMDYACKQWAGLVSASGRHWTVTVCHCFACWHGGTLTEALSTQIGTYYKPRWQLFLNQVLDTLKTKPRGTEFQVGAFQTAMYGWYDDWRQNATLSFATVPVGDPVAVSHALLKKWGPSIPDNAPCLLLVHGMRSL